MRHVGSVPALYVEEIDDRGPLAKRAITVTIMCMAVRHGGSLV